MRDAAERIRRRHTQRILCWIPKSEADRYGIYSVADDMGVVELSADIELPMKMDSLAAWDGWEGGPK